jgi:hypothetical protein
VKAAFPNDSVNFDYLVVFAHNEKHSLKNIADFPRAQKKQSRNGTSNSG